MVGSRIRHPDLYTLAAWTLEQGGQAGIPESIQRLRALPEPGNRLYADMLEVRRASQARDPRTPALLDSLDAALRRSTVTYDVRAQGNLTAARTFEELGDQQRAFGATQRVLWNLNGDRYISTILKERGRLGAMIGERDAAVKAYETWLTLMGPAEASVADEVERVRAEWARLGGGG